LATRHLPLRHFQDIPHSAITMTPAPTNPRTTGVSLTQDAWRRLRRNRVAMLSLGILAAVVVLAVLTPLLPLAAPDYINTELQLTPPSRTLWNDGALPEGKTDKQPEDDVFFRFDPEADKRWRKEASDLAPQIAASLEKLRAADGEAYLSAWDEYRNLSTTQRGLVQRAYRDAGFPELGPLARLMVRVRYAVFGKGQIGSLCGRDILGKDILSRIFWGARVSLIVGFMATLVSLLIGVTYGLVSGYSGGSVDNAMMRFVDVLYSIPFIFVVIFIITIVFADEWKPTLEYYGVNRLLVFYAVVGAIYWLTMSRVVRGQVLSIKNEPFVEAARALGVSRVAILFKHILPNLLSVVIVYLTLTIPRVILFEAFLSFLGLGVEPPDVSWGLLANEGIRVITPVELYWWLILFPSLAIGITLFALNFLGDGLRDAFDPRLREQ
ncbi:MAG: ABC transporter permease, partial [Planctomycetales bacterium]|nr:ABC transporter permease [Planctomycetales bacterium]